MHPNCHHYSPDEEIRIGGQGLRLLRGFAHTLEYEQTAKGNRLRIEFFGDRLDFYRADGLSDAL